MDMAQDFEDELKDATQEREDATGGGTRGGPVPVHRGGGRGEGPGRGASNTLTRLSDAQGVGRYFWSTCKDVNFRNST